MKANLKILALHVMAAAGRIFGIPRFRYYALADGIKEILTKTEKASALVTGRGITKIYS